MLNTLLKVTKLVNAAAKVQAKVFLASSEENILT